jgi:hypothetical protein
MSSGVLTLNMSIELVRDPTLVIPAAISSYIVEPGKSEENIKKIAPNSIGAKER